MPIGCVKFARYCDKMNSTHFFPHGGLNTRFPLFCFTTLRDRLAKLALVSRPFRSKTRTNYDFLDVFPFPSKMLVTCTYSQLNQHNLKEKYHGNLVL